MKLLHNVEYAPASITFYSHDKEFELGETVKTYLKGEGDEVEFIIEKLISTTSFTGDSPKETFEYKAVRK